MGVEGPLNPKPQLVCTIGSHEVLRTGRRPEEPFERSHLPQGSVLQPTVRADRNTKPQTASPKCGDYGEVVNNCGSFLDPYCKTFPNFAYLKR